MPTTARKSPPLPGPPTLRMPAPLTFGLGSTTGRAPLPHDEISIGSAAERPDGTESSASPAHVPPAFKSNQSGEPSRMRDRPMASVLSGVLSERPSFASLPTLFET